MEPLLTYQSVEVSFNGLAVTHDVSFTLHSGEILGIVGESGSGKSTLLKAAMGLLGSSGLVTRGDIWFQGKDLPDLPERELRKIRGAKIGMIFQDAGASLCPIRTIGDQIYESMSAHMEITRAQAKEKALALFEKLQFRNGPRIWDSYPFELSGGMNQRAGIAIAMLMEPPVLLADEPTSALDVAVQKQVVEEMLRLRELFGTAIILVTHDIGGGVRYGGYRAGAEKRAGCGIRPVRGGFAQAAGSLYPAAAGSGAETAEGIRNGRIFRRTGCNQNLYCRGKRRIHRGGPCKFSDGYRRNPGAGGRVGLRKKHPRETDYPADRTDRRNDLSLRRGHYKTQGQATAGCLPAGTDGVPIPYGLLRSTENHRLRRR